MKDIKKKINIALLAFTGVVCLAEASSVSLPVSLSSIQSDAADENSFELTEVIPKKIFTPAGEYSGYIEFIYLNPKEARVPGAVYSLRGAFISFMENGNSGNVGNSSGSLLWRGKYSSGSYVPGGVYLYRIEVTGEEEKVISGTVVVAR